MHDLAVIVVSIPGQAHWLEPCLRTLYAHAGGIALDVVVADNGSEEARALVEREFPAARVVSCANRGFAHGNNRALMTCDARYVLFLNPDTEILEGTLYDLLAELDAQPDIGVVGVRQVSTDGSLHPTMRRFPTPLRTLGDALGLERLPGRPAALGTRELELHRYEQEFACDWTIGSFMLVRREAIESAGFMDERFFIYAEEIDFCLRIRQSGWRIVHKPTMTILHHVGKGSEARSINERMAQQNAFAQRQYARKHFRPGRRAAFHVAMVVGYGLRSLPIGGASAEGRRASRAALSVLLGRSGPPFEEPPGQAVALRTEGGAETQPGDEKA
jgi:N-acetylglucosaminyl-diphospho-decaprenol L-rhamnosyltransferase